MAKYFVHYNMNVGGEYVATQKDAIRKGYGYLKSHPTAKQTVSINRMNERTRQLEHIGIMYWNSIKGEKKIVFSKSGYSPGVYNVVHADGVLGKKIPVNFGWEWRTVNGVTKMIMIRNKNG